MALAFIWFCSDMRRDLSVKVGILDSKIKSEIYPARVYFGIALKLCSNWNLFDTHSVIMWFPSFRDRIK